MDKSPLPSEIRWLSPLGNSVLLFLVTGTLYVLLGAITPVMMDTELGSQILMMSARTDGQLFGVAPASLLGSNPAMVQFR